MRDDGGSLDYDWIVWDLQVKDPHRRTEPGIAGRTKQAVAELAGTLGCDIDSCIDDDEFDNGTPYYAWRVRVPRAEHVRRDHRGIPDVLGRIWQYLRSQLPSDVDDWSISPDLDLTRRLNSSRATREIYNDVLRPVEVALLGLRRDGAQRLDPVIEPWVAADEMLVSTYSMPLAWEDADNEHSPWLVVQLGLFAQPPFWASPAGRRMTQRGFAPGTPILTVPRAAQPVWLADLTTTGFCCGPSLEAVPTVVGARHQWTSPDPEALARCLRQDLPRLLPRLAQP